MIKYMLIGTLIVTSYLIGDFIYKIYTNRHKHLSDFIRILEIVRMDITFGLYTLEEVFYRLGDNNHYLLSNYFKSIALELSKEDGRMLEGIIDEKADMLIKEYNLNSKEVDEIKKLILTLGKSDIEAQQRMIDLSINNFKKFADDSKIDLEQRGSLYKKVSPIIGIAIAIILF